MVPDTIKAGSVVWYEVETADAGKAAEWVSSPAGRIPALVVSPVSAHRSNGRINRTAYLVPLTSKADEDRNDDAIEIFHGELNARSESGRTFALCQLAFSAALDSDRVEIYRGKLVGNRQFALTVEGEQLDLVLGRLMLTMLGQRRFRRFTNGYLKAMPAMIRKRQEASRNGADPPRVKNGYAHDQKDRATKRRRKRLHVTPVPASPRPSRKNFVRTR